MKKLLAIVAGLLMPLASFAGGGYIITESGAPSEWDNSASIRIHPQPHPGLAARRAERGQPR